MGPRASVKVKGADTLHRTLGRFASEVDDLGTEAVAGGRIVAQTARARAPRRSGRMVASVTVTAKGNTAEVAASAAHAGPLNFGVGPRPGLRGPHNIRATRWLTGSLEPATPQVVSVYDRAVDSALARVSGA